MARMRSVRLAACLAVAACASPVRAQDAGGGWQLFGGVTLITLGADASGVDPEITASGDLFVSHTGSRGDWLFYVEGNTSLDGDGISTVFAEANADAGTALDRNRNGRLQISEANYRFAVADGAHLTLGLIDATAYLDRTRITNDENLQFIGVPFVNNPTIEFPDYTLGFALEAGSGEHGMRINAVAAASNGLADNPKVSYSQLLQIDGPGKGVFAGAGLGWLSEAQLLRFGAWVNTRSHESLGNGSPGHDNYGVYGVYGLSRGRHALSIRAGAAREDVSLAARFLALAYRLQWREHALGAGVARTFLSDDAGEAGLSHGTQAEIFARMAIAGGRAHVTGSLQYLRNSSFVARREDPRRDAVIGALRFRYEF